MACLKVKHLILLWCCWGSWIWIFMQKQTSVTAACRRGISEVLIRKFVKFAILTKARCLSPLTWACRLMLTTEIAACQTAHHANVGTKVIFVDFLWKGQSLHISKWTSAANIKSCCQARTELAWKERKVVCLQTATLCFNKIKRL